MQDAQSSEMQVDFLHQGRPALMPVDLSKGTIFFEAYVNGTRVWVLLDNGSDNTLIDSTLARELGIPLVGADKNIRSPSGVLRTFVAERIKLQIPNQIEMTGPVYAADLAPISDLIDRPIGLVLGNDVLANLSYVIDARNSRILFVSSGAIELNGPNVRTVSFDNGILKGRLNGRDVRLRIDLGSSYPISIFENSWAKIFGDVSGDRTSTSADASGHAQTVEILTEIDFELAQTSSKTSVTRIVHPSTEIDGHVGFSFFADKVVVIDQDAGVLTLVERTP